MGHNQSKSRTVLARVGIGAGALLAMVLLFSLDVQIARWAAGRDGALAALLERGSVLLIAFVILTLRAASELDRILRATGARPYAWFSRVMIAALMLLPWLSAAGWLGSRPADVEGLYWQLAAIMAAIVGCAVIAVVRRTPEGTVRDQATTMLSIGYLGLLPSFAVQLRCGRNLPEQEGAWLLLIVLLVTKAGDIGAYLAGSTFGRRKLIPSISPGKTVEGLAGGMILSAAAAIGCVETGVSLSFSQAVAADGNRGWISAGVFGLGIAIFGLLGDLFESCLKRDAHAKDSGSWIPQYGGILDLIDSPIVTVAVAWFILTGVLEIG